MSGVQILTVSEDDGEMRLDRWLKKKFPQLNQVAVEKMCRKGELRIDGGRAKPADRIVPGQKVRVPPLPTEAPPLKIRGMEEMITEADAEMIQSCVMFRDQHLIVINKPAGLPSQGGSGLDHRTVDGLTPALMFGYKERPKLVHRLDKDTSGLLVLARTDRVARALSEAFRERTTRKIYWAAVAGVPHPKFGTIRYALEKSSGHGRSGEGEKMICIHPAKIKDHPEAKRSTTDYAVMDLLGTRVSWAALVPITGRTHQLRAHMAELGHPIIGDGKYGGSAQENMGDGWGAQLGGEISRKLHLHARLLAFQHPITKQHLTFRAPLPSHMEKTWKTLGWDINSVPDDPFEWAEEMAERQKRERQRDR
ncbi:RluA family pseudouridine synthase [Falsigemmobacter faecalis]|uniref:Pseudouridine synthase n=1 Tax=Falsigemmobacter faecalis TaxID=2488730 RepID=A0A3P3DUY3_9RHOB|nr:RluA family pseudouridine synthase [Falsigemmobacter faecalis]RRH78040.1 RluA family pseudouridine synthase [Falsigemmobacter faecalis]